MTGGEESTIGEALSLQPTQRGFMRAEFTDYYDQKCSLQQSSLAEIDAIWLGVDVDLNGKRVNARMHLTREDVATLLPHLIRFSETGEL